MSFKISIEPRGFPRHRLVLKDGVFDDESEYIACFN